MSLLVRSCCVLAALTLGAALYMNTVVPPTAYAQGGPTPTPTPSPMPTTITVNSLSDTTANDGLCTLREAIMSANTNTASGAAAGECAAGGGLDSIKFSVTGTILLTSALPDLTTAMALNGPGARLLTVSGNDTTRVFFITNTASVNLSGLTISGGKANGGAGLSNSGALTINECAITDNHSTGSAGGISNCGTLTVGNSTISHNAAVNQGGGILSGGCGSGSAVLTNTTVSSNSAAIGGGIVNANGFALRYSTVTANSATNLGGGIYNPGIGILNFGNTIIAGNSATSSGPDGSGAQFNSEDYNLIGNTAGLTIIGTTTHNVTNVSANLGPLADNGGATETHRPLYTSPAVDKGKSANAGFGVLNDQRGLARPLNFTEVPDAAGGDGSDIGAVELQGDDQPESGNPPFVVNSVADTNDGSCDAAGTGTGNQDCTLREAVIAANARAGADTINFDPNVFAAPGPHTIGLTGSLPIIGTSMTINGPGAGVLTLRRSMSTFYSLLFLAATPVRVSGMTLTNGRAPNAVSGGALLNIGVATLTDVRVTDNRSGDAVETSSAIGHGGGIYNTGTLTLVNCLVSGNSTGNGMSGGVTNGGGGGGIYSSGVLMLTNCLVNGNSTGTGPNAGGDGGGVYASGTATLTNTTVSNNTTGAGGFASSRGGGIYANGLTLTLTNSTITGNSSRFTENQGVDVGPSQASISVGNTIIARNGTSTQSDLTGLPNWFVSRGHNIIGIASNSGGGNAFIDGQNGDRVGTPASPFNPLLAALGDYGGPTQTFALLPGSPGIDAGTSTGAPAQDQRGVSRVGAVDIGAFESRGFQLAATAGTPQSATIFTTFGTPMSATVTSAFGEPTAGGLVTFSAPASGASGTFAASPTVSIDAGGVATAPAFTANGIAGSYNVTASAGPSSTTFALTNLKRDTATAVSSSASPSAVGQSVTFTATVTSATGTPTGTVQFKVDGTNAGATAPLNSGGVATFATSGLTPGAHTVAAEYGGDSNFNASSGTLPGGQTVGSLVEFGQAAYSVAEGGSLTVTVKRTGDPSQAAGVDYATDDGSTPSVAVPCSSTTGLALDRCDYTKALGTLSFAAGETEKTFTLLTGQDSYVEGAETFQLKLSNPKGNAAVGPQGTATVTIADDSPETTGNAIDDTDNFVRQHYLDFLNREPDAPGFQFWRDGITVCGADAQCREVKRIDTSAAFFLSIEFQETGYLVYRMFKTAYGDATSPNVPGTVPVIRFNEFLPDTQRIGQGIIVGANNWQQQLEANKQTYALEFVQRPRFLAAFPAPMTATEFVSKLDENAGGVLSADERAQLIASLGATPSDAAPRAAALRQVAEHATLRQRETNRAFVLMQFYGYLRRDPDAAPDTDFRGWKFWLSKLEEFGGDYRRAEMVKAFLDSTEYRQRFGQQ